MSSLTIIFTKKTCETSQVFENGDKLLFYIKQLDDYQKVCLMADLLSEDLVKRNMQEEWKEDLAKKGLNYTEV